MDDRTKNSDYDPKKCQCFPAAFKCLGSGPCSCRHPLLGTAALTLGRDYVNMQISSGDTLYLGRDTNFSGVPSFELANDWGGFRRLPKPLFSLLRPQAKGTLPGELLPAFLSLWNNVIKLLWICLRPSKLQMRDVIIITGHCLWDQPQAVSSHAGRITLRWWCPETASLSYSSGWFINFL